MTELEKMQNVGRRQYDYVQKNTKLSVNGSKYMIDTYKKIYKMGIVVRCNNIVTDVNGNKMIYFSDPLYPSKTDANGKKILNAKSKEIADKSKPPIQYMSKYDIYRNSLHIFTGKTHGGYIGIDIDVSISKGFNCLGIATFYSELFKNNISPNTLTCKTPSGGMHLVYKLTQKQLENLGNITSIPQLKLFGMDIDILYTTGRFIMAGAYYNTINNRECVYEIICESKPMNLPDFIYLEILNKLISEGKKDIKKCLFCDELTYECQTCTYCNVIIDELSDLHAHEVKPGINVPIYFCCRYCILKYESKVEELKKNTVVRDKCKSLYEKFVKDNDEKNKKIIPGSKCENKYIEYKKIYIKDKDYLFKTILSGLAQKRCDEYKYWSRIGMIAANKGFNYEIFNEWSKGTTKNNYDEIATQKIWNTAINNTGIKKIGIPTILNMLKEDNEEVLKKVQELISDTTDEEVELQNILKNGPGDYDIASYYFKKYKNNFIYAPKQKCWYKINKYNIWIKDDDGNVINCNIMENVGPDIKKSYTVITDNLKDIARNKQGYDKEVVLKKLATYNKNYEKTKKYLQSYSNKKNCLHQLKGIWDEDEIYEKLDNVNNYLFAFNNKVYDLKTNEIRLARPEEYITETCGYDFEEKTPNIIAAMKDIKENIFGSMFEKLEDVDTLMYDIAQSLDGNVRWHSFYIMSGVGANGKGTTVSLVKNTFGKYYYEMDFNYLVQDKHGVHANAPDEILANMKNSRIVITTEASKDCTLKINKIKDWAGGATVSCRFLNKGLFSYKPKFRLFIQSNHDLNLPDSNSEAIMRRLNVRGYPYKFVDEKLVVKGTFTKPKDYTLDERISKPEYKMGFFYLLLEYYEKLKNLNKIPVSSKFIEDRDSLIAMNDNFTPFYDDIVIHKINAKDKMTTFHNAYKKYNHNNKCFNTSDFKSAMMNRGHKTYKSKGYLMYKDIAINEKKLEERLTKNKSKYVQEINYQNELDFSEELLPDNA